MQILVLNAGSSSLKATLKASADGSELARGLADWAGPVTRYQFVGPDGRERSEEVPWRGHAKAVEMMAAIGLGVTLAELLSVACNVRLVARATWSTRRRQTSLFPVPPSPEPRTSAP
jgi:acetate kinase